MHSCQVRSPRREFQSNTLTMHVASCKRRKDFPVVTLKILVSHLFNQPWLVSSFLLFVNEGAYYQLVIINPREFPSIYTSTLQQISPSTVSTLRQLGRGSPFL